MATIALLCGTVAVAHDKTPTDDVQLFGNAASEGFYAAGHFMCRGMSINAARRAANRALGRDFQKRLQRAGDILEVRGDSKAVDQAATFVTVAFIVTPDRCRQVRDIIPRALSDMNILEQRLGIK